MKRQARDRHDWSAIERRIIKAVHQMDGARARRANAHPETSRILGKAACHEGGRLLVANADIADTVPAFPQSLDN